MLNLLNLLGSVVGALELEAQDPLRRELGELGDRLTHPCYRIVVFGPFNYGKSTLLNAILGEKALPMDLIPTTGAAIRVRYGQTLQSRIKLRDGSVQVGEGTALLQEFARLDDQGHLRQDLAAVEVDCPHPFLQQGVELLDLPGTDDRDAQDHLVQNQLLTADLVIQLLDGRKLMTLGEREHLRDWLQDRGIDTVLFVVNFLNLLEPNDQQQVMNRMRFVAESFRSRLPAGVSNLYRVDALPALRARLKGDGAALQSSGILPLESALDRLVQAHQPDISIRPQLLALTQTLQQTLAQRIAQLDAAVSAAAHPIQVERWTIQRQAQVLIRQGFEQDLKILRDWLEPLTLLQRYEGEAIASLQCSAFQQSAFKQWEAIALQSPWESLCRNWVDWIEKACDLFECDRPTDPQMPFPHEPRREIETQIKLQKASQVGPSVSADSVAAPSVSDWTTSLLVKQAVRRYFEQLSLAGLAAIAAHEPQARQIIHWPLPETSPSETARLEAGRLTLLRNLHIQLETLGEMS